MMFPDLGLPPMPRLITFGGLTVENGTLINGVANPRSRLAILAVLAVAGDRGVRREKLAAMFWPESDEERSRNALRQALFTLRRDIGAGDITIGVADLRLDGSLLSADVTEFDSAIRARCYDDAVALYRGPFLDGVFVREAPGFEEWVEDQRRRLSADYGRALEAIAAAARQAGDFGGAATWWGRRATHDRLSARVALRYMEALVAAGDREAAIRYAATYASVVRAELEADPDAEVLAFAEHLRGNGSAAAIPRAEAIAAEQLDAEAGAAARVPAAETHLPASRRRLTRFAVAALGLATLAVGLSRMSRASAGPLVVGVEQIQNRTGDSTLNQLGRAATGDIRRQIVQSGHVAVVDLAADSGRRSGTLATEAGADRLVRGDMYKKGDSILVQMRVVDPRNGQVMHELNPVTVPAVNTSAILARLSSDVGGAIAALTDTLFQPWLRAHSRPPNYPAFQQFMLGLDAIIHTGRDSAIVHLKNAVRLDTSFAEAKILLLEQIDDSPRQRAYSDSIMAAAIRQRDAMSAFDRYSLDRRVAIRAGRWEDAYVAARRMMELAPETQDAQVYLANTAMATRRFSEAIAVLHRIDRTRGWLKDLNQIWMWDLTAHRLRGEFGIALAEWRQKWDASTKTYSLCMTGLQHLAVMGRERAVDSLLAECTSLQDAPPRADAVANEWSGRWYRTGGYPEAMRRAFKRGIDLRSKAVDSDSSQRVIIGFVDCELGNWRDAYAILRAAEDSSDEDQRLALGIAAAHVGDTVTVRATLEWIDTWRRRDPAIRGRDTHDAGVRRSCARTPCGSAGALTAIDRRGNGPDISVVAEPVRARIAPRRPGVRSPGARTKIDRVRALS